jgi:adenylate cyclase class 2
MHYEVETKYRVLDPPALEERLRKLGVALGEPCEESDQFYQHPSRDFSRTDEGLRIRRSDDQFFITYKGPKIDSKTKTRKELELPIDSPDQETGTAWDTLLRALSFTPVAKVRKTRRRGKMLFQGRPFEITLDELPGLGTFAEIDTSAGEDNLQSARDALLALADQLGLEGAPIRRSYLAMVLEQEMESTVEGDA